MPVITFSPIMADGDLHLTCNGCGTSISSDLEVESYFSENSDGCSNGNYIGESGYYCDNCYPRCYCRDCFY